MSRYCEISAEAFTAAMAKIDFKPVSLPGVYEIVFERFFNEARFSVRVYSSVSIHTSTSRFIGSDSIRVLIHDHELDTNISIADTYRTKNALSNVVLRCREAWAWKNDHKCTCGAIMAKRQAKNGYKFFGCSAFGKTECKETRPL